MPNRYKHTGLDKVKEQLFIDYQQLIWAQKFRPTILSSGVDIMNACFCSNEINNIKYRNTIDR